MKRHELNLIATRYAGEAGISPLQLQKVLFLIGKKVPQLTGEDFYNFIPYNYGPFCKQIYNDSEILANWGAIEITKPLFSAYNVYKITPKGIEESNELEKSIDPALVDYIRKLVAWAQNQSFQQLVRKIYELFPEYKKNSVFQG